MLRPGITKHIVNTAANPGQTAKSGSVLFALFLCQTFLYSLTTKKQTTKFTSADFQKKS